MHDGAVRYYETDTAVVDVDDWNPREDLTVQIRDDNGTWHRKAIGGFHTACGDPIEHRLGQELRHERYDGQVCSKGCFSRWELEKTAENNASENEETSR